MHEVILRNGLIKKAFHINCPTLLLPERIEKLVRAADESYQVHHTVGSYKTITCAACGHPDSHDNGSLRTGCAHDGCGCEIFQIGSQNTKNLLSHMSVADYLQWKSRIDAFLDESTDDA